MCRKNEEYTEKGGRTDRGRAWERWGWLYPDLRRALDTPLLQTILPRF